MPKGVHSGHLRGLDHPVAKAWVPPCPEAALREMYEIRGMSQQEVASELGVTLKRIQTAMRRFGISPRPQIKRDQRGSKNATWKGSDAGYQALHVRVRVERGAPMRCERCGTDDPEKVYEWANLTGDYNDVDDYERMCRSCHRQHDHARKGVLANA